jgi:hypothetical protein
MVIERTRGAAMSPITAIPVNSFIRPVGVVWLLFAVNALAILVTYARLPPDELYHTSRDGLAGGAGRALVFLNFPTAFAAIAIIGLAVAALTEPGSRRRGWLAPLAVAAMACCLVAAVPGVVDQGDLDARPINVIPALGVIVALVLSAIARRATDRDRELAWTGRDRAGIALVAIASVVSLPWILADVGVYIDEVPILGRIFIASEIPPGATLPAVHVGHHHGLDGLLFIATAVLLARTARSLSRRRLVSGLRVYLAFMLGYGLANLLNDAWLEQVVKRGWTDRRVPSYLRPDLSLEWAVLIIGVVATWFVMFWRADQPVSSRVTAAEQVTSRVS